MPEAEMLCDRIAFLRHGHVVALDTPQNLKNQLHLGERMLIRYEGSIEVEKLNAISGVMSAKVLPGEAEIIIDRKAENVGQIIKLFSNANILDIEIKEPDLEDVFLELAR
jgi:ABC-2 type transport system ATP-binding protein